MEKQIKFVGFRASKSLAARAKAQAKIENRSLAGYLRNLVEKDLGIKHERPEK
jgi:hypothetical protein